MTQKDTEAQPQGPQLQVSPGPHLWGGMSISRIMWLVVGALMFPTGSAIYHFGPGVLSIIGVSLSVAILTEFVSRKIRGRPFVMDGSSVVTGLLLALVLPPTVSLWMVAVGSMFAIAIVKEVFGGLGHNIFNPALGGRAFMAASFAGAMTTWTAPTGFTADAVTIATPLSDGFTWTGSQAALYQAMFWGNTGGSLGETSALMILIGGCMLLGLKIIKWRIPSIYISTVALISLAMGQDPLFHILGGGLMLGAFFMATDYVTSPLTNKGQVIFAISLGVLTMLIRRFGGMPEGVCYSILFMNALTPAIDRFFRTRPYGVTNQKAAASEA